MVETKRVWPSESWHFNEPVNGSLAIRCQEMIFIAGQVALSRAGEVRHPGDLPKQTDLAMTEVETALAACGATLADMVKLVVFYVDRNGEDGIAMLKRIRDRFKGPDLPVITLVPVPWLAIAGLAVEIEGYAMKDPQGATLPRQPIAPAGHWQWPQGLGFPQALRCGEMLFVGQQMAFDGAGRLIAPGDIVTQTDEAMKNIGRLLSGAGCDFEDVVKFNIYYSGRGGTEEWQRAAVVRARYFKEPGPAATGIPIPRQYPTGAMTQMEVIAMRGIDGRRLPKAHVWPEGHWDWPIHLPYKHGLKCGRFIFVGGQVPLDGKGKAIAGGDLVEQTKISMEYIRRILAGFGAGFGDVCKVNCVYVGNDDQTTLMRSAKTRFAHYPKPGPSSTGVPLPALAIENMDTEIEVVAMVDP